MPRQIPALYWLPFVKRERKKERLFNRTKERGR
jgi:hypothetical protein